MLEKIIIPQQNVIHIVDPLQITFCQSDNCYTWVYLAGGERHLIVKSLTKFAKDLNSAVFIRVNQSYLVNKNFIRSIDKKKKCIVLLQNQDIPFTITIKQLLSMLGKSVV